MYFYGILNYEGSDFFIALLTAVLLLAPRTTFGTQASLNVFRINK